MGTCPKCEAEVQYLERELANRRSLGRRVAIAGIAAGITLAATGCSEDIKNLFAMTPYYYKTGRNEAERLLNLKNLTTTVHFGVEVYRKR